MSQQFAPYPCHRCRDWRPAELSSARSARTACKRLPLPRGASAGGRPGCNIKCWQAIGLVAIGAAPLRNARAPARLLAAGTLIFSGSLYAMALSGARWLGAVTPIGGAPMIAGWAWLAWRLAKAPATVLSCRFACGSWRKGANHHFNARSCLVSLFCRPLAGLAVPPRRRRPAQIRPRHPASHPFANEATLRAFLRSVVAEKRSR